MTIRIWILSLIACGGLGAQARFDPLLPGQIGSQIQDSDRAVLGDLDGDGDLDLIIGSLASPGCRLYLNDGTGRFDDLTSTHLPPTTAFGIALGDLDGDGDLDIIMCDYRRDVALQNDGMGRFTNVTAQWLPSTPTMPAQDILFFDADGDGDLDVALARGAQNRLLLNDGTGVLTEATATHMPVDREFSRGVAAGDIDGDGDLDLIFANGGKNRLQGDPNLLYVNDGSGRFSDVSSAQLPTIQQGYTHAATFGDVDADGDLDLVFANYKQDNLLLNDGRGCFTDATNKLPQVHVQTPSIELVDIDADGDLDQLVGQRHQTSRSAASNLLIRRNDGSGGFSDAPSDAPRIMPTVMSTASGDVDLDGDLDVVVAVRQNARASAGPDVLCRNDGTGKLELGSRTRLPPHRDVSRTAVFLDANGDGIQDLYVGSAIPHDRLYLGVGDGYFRDVTTTHLPRSNSTRRLAVADIDRDGDPDIATLTGVLLNIGDKGFIKDNARLQLQREAVDLAFGDFDADGSVDLFVTNDLKPDQLFLNDGMGHFRDATSGRMTQIVTKSRRTVVADFDMDGDLDIYAVTTNLDLLHLNDGTGRFVSSTVPTTTGRFGVAKADVDGDGDQDILKFGNGPNRLMLNDGSAGFRHAAFPEDSQDTVAATFGDLDGDGDLDHVVNNLGEELDRVYLNDGQGRFVEATDLFTELPPHAEFSLIADVDGDLDNDVVVVVDRGEDRLFLNLGRHIDYTIPPRIGRNFVWRIYGRRTGATAALPIVAAARGRSAIPPFGVLLLDPSLAVLLPAVAIPPSGHVDVMISVPNAPGLIGSTIHLQALVGDWPQWAHFTNALSETIR